MRFGYLPGETSVAISHIFHWKERETRVGETG